MNGTGKAIASDEVNRLATSTANAHSPPSPKPPTLILPAHLMDDIADVTGDD
jgi:hypothetical protein